MKKVLISLVAVVAVAGCSSYYDYYKGGVRYVQDGTDCIYYSGEQGRHFGNSIEEMNSGKKIVYRNTICAHLFEADNAHQSVRPERKVLAPAAVAPTCNACAAATPCGRTRKYVIMPA